MGHRTKSVRAGERFLAPRSRVRDLGEAEQHPDDLLLAVRRASAGDRLSLEGAQYAAPPAALEELEYVCDSPELTGFAGLPALMQFAYGVGLAERLAQLPWTKRRSVYSPAKLCEVVVALLAAGLERVSHVDDVTFDPGLCRSLGLERLPDQATLSRLFSEASERSVSALRELNREFVEQALTLSHPPRQLVVDCDTRSVRVYGKQEGTVHTRRSGKQAQYTFEVAALRNTHDILDGGLLPGATHPAPLFVEPLRGVLEQLGPKAETVTWCADAAWYSGEVLQALEMADADPQVPCAVRYAIRAQLSSSLLATIMALPESAWRPCAEGVEIAEVRWAFRGSRHDREGRERRYIVTRTARPERAREGQQGKLFELGRYEYAAIVTTLEWRPRRVWAFYNARATVESILKESALGFHMDSLPSATFLGNALFAQLLILAYNLVNLFRRLGLPREASRHQAPTLQRRVLALPGRVERTGRGCRIHVAREGPAAQWLAPLARALRIWLEPLEPLRLRPSTA